MPIVVDAGMGRHTIEQETIPWFHPATQSFDLVLLQEVIVKERGFWYEREKGRTKLTIVGRNPSSTPSLSVITTMSV